MGSTSALSLEAPGRPLPGEWIWRLGPASTMWGDSSHMAGDFAAGPPCDSGPWAHPRGASLNDCRARTCQGQYAHSESECPGGGEDP